MTHFTKTLLAGAASIALLAIPAFAQSGTRAMGVTDAVGGDTMMPGSSGVSDNAGAPGTMGTTGAPATGDTRTMDQSDAAASSSGMKNDGMGSNAGTTMGATGSISANSADGALNQLTLRGYTDIQRKDTGSENQSHTTYTAHDSAGNRMELVVNTNTAEIVRATPKHGKNQ